jgi:hypothetical protein
MLSVVDMFAAAAAQPQVGVGRDGHLLLCGPPLVQLGGHFPLQQPLMGHLVPQSVNMWMGCAPEGARRTALDAAFAVVACQYSSCEYGLLMVRL